MADNYPVGYSHFLALNTLGFFASLSVILLLMSSLPLRSRFFIWILIVIMGIAIPFIVVTYDLSISALNMSKYVQHVHQMEKDFFFFPTKGIRSSR